MNILKTFAGVNADGVQDEARIASEDVLRVLKTPPAEPYSLIFMDPPYRKNLANPALKLLATRRWLAPGAFVTAEIEKDARVNLPAEWTLEAERLFGQTRICIWTLP